MIQVGWNVIAYSFDGNISKSAIGHSLDLSMLSIVNHSVSEDGGEVKHLGIGANKQGMNFLGNFS